MARLRQRRVAKGSLVAWSLHLGGDSGPWLLLPRPIGVFPLPFLRAIGARGRTAEMLRANLLRQAGIPCCSYRWGCSNTDHDPCGDGGPRRGRSDPQACRYPPVHPTSELSRQPASAGPCTSKTQHTWKVSSTARQNIPGKMHGDRFVPSCHRVSLRPRLCPWEAVDRPHLLCSSPLPPQAIPTPADRTRLPWCNSSVPLAADRGKTCYRPDTTRTPNLGSLER